MILSWWKLTLLDCKDFNVILRFWLLGIWKQLLDFDQLDGPHHPMKFFNHWR